MPAMLARLFSYQWGRFVLFVLGWGALSLLFAPEAYLSFYVRGEQIPWRETLQLTVVNSAIALLFVPGIVWVTRRAPIVRGNLRGVLMAHVPACLAFSLAHSGLYWVACHAWHEVGGTLFYRFHPNLLTYWAVVGFTQAVDSLRRAQEQERRAAGLHLRLLKAQLHPHFLFNTLHAISAMMREDVAAADRMINRLSELLRIALANAEKDEVTLAEELAFVGIYLDIQRVRCGSQLETIIEADADTRDALVPALFLQPLVENGLRHGLASTGGNGRILIRAGREDDRLVLQVCDNGSGLPSGRRLREGVGLSTTRARLEQLYPQYHAFELRANPDGGVEARAEIPFKIARHSVPSQGERVSHAHSNANRGRRAMGQDPDRIAPQY